MAKKKMKMKTIKPKIPIDNNILIIILILLLIYAIFCSSKCVLQTKDITTTITTTTTILTTSTISPTTIIPIIQTCSNFEWTIDDIEDFDLKGDYRIVVVDFTARYTGSEEANYGWVGAYKFNMIDEGKKYYNPEETYLYCDISNKFEIGTVDLGDKASGCLEFRILDANEPMSLLFYDRVVDTMCEIDLS